MPPKARRRPVVMRVYKTIDRPKQTYFTPRNRTVLNRNPSLSAPTTRQQTLTQIDFVSRLPVEDVDMDFDYVPEETPRAKKKRRVSKASDDQDEDASYEEPVPRKRKRRKTAPVTFEGSNDVPDFTDQASPVRPKRKPVSKSTVAPKVKIPPSKESAKKTAKKSTKGGKSKPEEVIRIYEESPNSPQAQSRRSSEIMMPPPRTPKTAMKTEIPSSQSPGNTPLSMHSRRSVRDISRSPLKEKSSNRCMTKSSKADGRKSVLWTPRLEVKDTYEGEPLSPVKKISAPRVPKLVIQDTFDPGSEGSELSTITQSSKSDTMSQKRRVTLDLDFPASDLQSTSLPSDSVQLRQVSTRNTSTPTLETIQLDLSIKTEIQDTDDEHHEGHGDEDEFDIGLDTQAALDGAQTLPPDEYLEHERVPNIVEDFNNAMRAAAKGVGAAPLQSERSITTEHHPKPVINPTTPHTPRSKHPANNQFPLTTTQVPRTPLRHLSDSDQASAQLTADLLRQTQQLTNPLLSKGPLSKSTPRPSSTPILIEDDDDDAPPLPPPPTTHPIKTTPTPPTHRPPVPFSQATTVDITQSSPRPSYTQVPSSPQPTALPRSRTSFLDKPPRAAMPAVPALISSSPLGSTAERSSPVQLLWDGRPLTDSQLLPESLMQMTVPRPPRGLSQESLVEE